MKLADELFKKYTLIEAYLIPYGFSKEGTSYFYHRLIHNGEFDLQITVNTQKLEARLMELDFNEEYTAINRESLRQLCGRA